eukprot:gnl/MRDRNA2_/MRDRNA2_114658_c0_seq1.p1 gnl/MRDRNA2_/MRDRNA2_114658_c0~~gnl/MRDRNA2_/MRDRNA2_114658_c0_seq1.p1  ORF type:complete len:534 (-),score=121.99 gnl/MRDRNA2_/MRDRNA2_114658_c0_seq1:102-1616(-)
MVLSKSLQVVTQAFMGESPKKDGIAKRPSEEGKLRQMLETIGVFGVCNEGVLKLFGSPRRKQTTTGEIIVENLPICIPKVLMPKKDVDLAKWATVACDQFESEPHYWEAMAKHAGDSPSAMKIIFPEVYLASVTGADPSEDTKRIEEIGKTMKQYVADKVFDEQPAAFIALDRKTPCVPSRKGLIMAVDLEQYNYNCPVPTLIRPTEKTIPARLPPRVAIRKDAPLELPHIIMIIDDPDKSVIEPLFARGGLTEPEYQVDLFQGAGSVTGLRVNNAGAEHIIDGLKELDRKERQAAARAGREPALLLIGDGNHSLATAKKTWDMLKETGGVDLECHPARFALVELQNLHDDGVVFEPIHRILEGGNGDEVQAALEKAWGIKAEPYSEPVPKHAIVLVKNDKKEDSLILVPPMDRLPVVSMSEQVDAFASEHKEVRIGYVHGEEPVYAACKDGHAVGILLPSLDKTRFCETVHSIGTLPRKAFSMGEANEKRFYVEARNILPEAF